MIAARGVGPEMSEVLARLPMLQPFIKSGYSIYLWQGVGYSLAAYAGGELDANIYVIWIVAIALTIALGLLFSPLERIRLPKRRAG